MESGELATEGSAHLLVLHTQKPVLTGPCVKSCVLLHPILIAEYFIWNDPEPSGCFYLIFLIFSYRQWEFLSGDLFVHPMPTTPSLNSSTLECTTSEPDRSRRPSLRPLIFWKPPTWSASSTTSRTATLSLYANASRSWRRTSALKFLDRSVNRLRSAVDFIAYLEEWWIKQNCLFSYDNQRWKVL